MKKTLSWLMVICMSVLSFASCGKAELKKFSEYKDCATYKALCDEDYTDGFTFYMEASRKENGVSTNIETYYFCTEEKTAVKTTVKRTYKSISEVEETYNIIDGEECYTLDIDNKTYTKRDKKSDESTYSHPMEMFLDEVDEYETETEEYEGRSYTVDTITYNNGTVLEVYVSQSDKIEYIAVSYLEDTVFEADIKAGAEDDAYNIPKDYTEKNIDRYIYGVNEEFLDLASYKAMIGLDVSKGYAVVIDYDSLSIGYSLAQKFLDGKFLVQETEVAKGTKTVSTIIIKDGYQYEFTNKNKRYSKRSLKTVAVMEHPVEVFFDGAKYSKTETKEYAGETYTVDTYTRDGKEVSLYVSSDGEVKFMEQKKLIFNVKFIIGVDESEFDIPEGYKEAQ